MNPLRIKASNYRTFAALDLELPTGCVAILGTNGAGKSSLANVVDLALFGPEGRSWAPYLTQGAESTELEIELTFDHGGELYRVRRGYSGRGSGKTTLDLERNHLRDADDERGARPDSWIPETREAQAETQRYLEELLGMTRETFRASSMLVQGDGAAFTEAKPADRKRVLAKILGLERFDELLVLVKADRRRHEDRLQRIAGELEAADRELVGVDGSDRIEAHEEELSEVGATLAELGGQEDAAARELAALEEARTAGETLAHHKAKAIADVADAQGRLLPIKRRAEEAAEAETALAIVQDELETLTTTAQTIELQEKRAELAGMVEVYRQAVLARDQAERTRSLRASEKTAIEAQARAARERIAELDAKIGHVSSGELDSCPTCRQALGADAREATVAALRAQADQLAADAQAIEERASAIVLDELPELPPRPEEQEAEIRAIDERLAKARQDEIQKATLEGRAQVLRERIAAKPESGALEAAERAVVELQERLSKIDAPTDEEIAIVKANAASAKARADGMAARRRDLERDRTKIEAGLERLRELRDRTAAAREERTTIQAELAEIAILERGYGRDGLPALIIGRAAIPAIEVEACRILGELGTSYRVELRTEKALAGGGTADALDVVIVTEDGQRPYETFSGGERTRINLALRIALARLLAHRRGAESRILVIDEPEFLDQAGTAALATVLRGLAGDFERVYLISHVPELRDALDAVVEVVRGADGLSQIGGIA